MDVLSSFFSFVSFYFVWFVALLLGTSTFNIVVLSCELTLYHYKTTLFISGGTPYLDVVLADINITTPVSLWVLIAWHTFFLPFTFYVQLSLVSSIQLGHFFCNKSENICLLFEEFNPLTFNVIFYDWIYSYHFIICFLWKLYIFFSWLL